MAWRIHLSDNVVFRLDILRGTPDVLCAWVSDDEAAFFELETGAALGTFTVPLPDPEIPERESEAWLGYLDTLRAPNGARLPCIRTEQQTIYQTDDGSCRVYEDGHGLFVAHDGGEFSLGTADKSFVSVKVDRTDGVIAALDEHGKLYIHYQEAQMSVGGIGLRPQPNLLPDVVLSSGGASLFASDGRQLIRTTEDGIVRHSLTLSYPVGKIACSRDGSYCATSDSETGIIRVYSGDDLTFTHQKFAVDLFAKAKQVQLIADVPPPRLGISTLAITDDGLVAFAMDGILTVAELHAMEQMPTLFS